MYKNDKNIHDEKKYIKNNNNLAQKRINKSPSHQLRKDFEIESLERKKAFKNIKIYDSSTYKLPYNMEKFLGKKLYNELQEILFEIKKINDTYYDQDPNKIEIILHGDIEVSYIRLLLEDWANSYCNLRISRKNRRDKHPIDKFKRIYGELMYFLDKIAFRKDSIHFLFLASMTDHIPYILYKRILKPITVISKDINNNTYIDIKDEYKYSGAKEFVIKLIELYHFERKYLNFFFKKDLPITDDLILSLSYENKKKYLQDLASEIMEIRPLLIKGFNRIKSIEKIADKFFVLWSWNVNASIGMIMFGISEEDLIRQDSKSFALLPLSVNFDGLITDFKFPWVTVENYDNTDESSLDKNVFILKKIRDKLFSFYKKINFENIWKNKEHYNKEVSEEVFSIVCQKIAEVNQENNTKNNNISMIRSQKLLNILEKKFDCEIKQGKGSEITIFKQGGKKMILGHHKRNQYVNSFQIRSILNRLNISLQDWSDIFKIN